MPACVCHFHMCNAIKIANDEQKNEKKSTEKEITLNKRQMSADMIERHGFGRFTSSSTKRKCAVEWDSMEADGEGERKRGIVTNVRGHIFIGNKSK